LKILTTAGFAVVILNRNINSAKWRALLLLVLGCILVASPAYNYPIECIGGDGGGDAAALSTSSAGDSEYEGNVMQTILGFGAILAMNGISGFASIYFESMLKKTGEKLTIWERNFQLAFCSIWLLVGVVAWEMEDPSVENITFFKGWTINTILISLIQAGGGLLVAATLKYADSILKTLATSGSIVLSTILGHMLLGGTLDIFITIGCVSTILAICNYTFD
jgi:solute carrier family 35 (UDP-sugar transporter), member A1/2/3